MSRAPDPSGDASRRHPWSRRVGGSSPGPDAQAAKTQIAPNWNYTHISRDVLPMLRERGVTDEQIRQMLVDAPRRYFE